MQVEDHELEAIPGEPQQKRWFLRAVVDLLINVGDELLDKVITHVKEKRAEKASGIDS
ncbi:hypothetical protein [Spirosoma litoris]